MKKIIITAVNENGTSALKQHWKESKKMPLRLRIVFKASGYKQELVSKEPYTLSLLINNSKFQNKHYINLFKMEIQQAMEKNGANKEDYVIRIE